MNKMREITTHIVEGGPETCKVFGEEELGPGGAPHHYEIALGTTQDRFYDPGQPGEGPRYAFDFQKGGVVEAGGVNGVTHEALLAINIDRLEHFQRGPYPSPDNQEALDHMRIALECLQRRTRDRISRKVEGVSVA